MKVTDLTRALLAERRAQKGIIPVAKPSNKPNATHVPSHNG